MKPDGVLYLLYVFVRDCETRLVSCLMWCRRVGKTCGCDTAVMNKDVCGKVDLEGACDRDHCCLHCGCCRQCCTAGEGLGFYIAHAENGRAGRCKEPVTAAHRATRRLTVKLQPHVAAIACSTAPLQAAEGTQLQISYKFHTHGSLQE